jgi:hypothetical protein
MLWRQSKGKLDNVRHPYIRIYIGLLPNIFCKYATIVATGMTDPPPPLFRPSEERAMQHIVRAGIRRLYHPPIYHLQARSLVKV